MAWHGLPTAPPEGTAPRPGAPAPGSESAPASGVAIGLPLVIGLMMAGGWLALEWFNYAASQFALTSLFGHLSADGATWAAVLATGLWLVDLSGLLYLSIPSEREKPGFWYALVAWLMASGANALLKWWAVTLALMASPLAQPGAPRAAGVAPLMPYIPTAIAFLVWTGRVLLVSTMMGILAPALRGLAERVQGWADAHLARAAESPEEPEMAGLGPRLVTPEVHREPRAPEAASRRRLGER